MPGENTLPLVTQIEIKIDGSDLANDIMDKLAEVEIETSLYLPSMFILRFYDDDLALLDGAKFKEGKSVEIKMPNTANVLTPIIKGEITAIEPDFAQDPIANLVVRGYDRSHRLHRGMKSKVFVNVTDGDIVTQIASKSGLSATVDATPGIHEHVFQYGVSDWAFIHERARRNGFEVRVDDKTLYFQQASKTSGTLTLAWNAELVRFQPRFSLAKQVEKVTVKGWDPKNKQAIIGQASSSSSSPATGLSGWGGSLAQSAFSSSAEVLEVRHPVASQGEATDMAQAILDEINAGFLQADGIALGNPALQPGVKVTIQKVGTKFSGTYIVTTARHIYNPTDGYRTYFTVQGARAQTIADLIDQSMIEQRNTQLWGGIVTAIVTNNNDPENMARVKVKFPWLDDTLESGWARVSSISAGNQRGFLWLPEVNDEVLVAFEHGDFDYPYIVGAVWNGKDAMPEATSAAVSNGKVVVRTLKTTAGHIIRLTDTSGGEKIEIIGAKTSSKITLDEAGKKISLESGGDIELTATGNLTLKGASIKVEADKTFEATANTSAKVESTGALDLKGKIVNIN